MPIGGHFYIAGNTAGCNWFVNVLERASYANQLKADEISKLRDAFSQHSSLAELQKDLIAQSLLSTKASYHENRYFLERNLSLKETRILRKFEKNVAIDFNPILWKYELTGFWKWLNGRFKNLSKYLKNIQLTILYVFIVYAVYSIGEFLYMVYWLKTPVHTGVLMMIFLFKILVYEFIAVSSALYFKKRSELIWLLKYKC